MEQPFYHKLNDFEENYLNDFDPSHTTLLKYLNQYKKKYEDFLNERYMAYFKYKTTAFAKVSDLLEKKLNYNEKILLNNLLENTDMVDLDHNLKSDPEDFFYDLNDSLGTNITNKDLISHYVIEWCNNERERRKESLNSYQAILSAIKNKIENEKNVLLRFQTDQSTREIQKPETPENDFSDNPDKVKLIMLEKLGVIDFIKSIQAEPDRTSHTSEILSSFTGINSKTLNTYLNPMLQPIRDDSHQNSPYKNPDNLLEAEKAIIKLKIKKTDANR